MFLAGLRDAIARWAEARRRRAAAGRELDRLFSERASLLVAARLKPRHRPRINVLELDCDGRGQVRRLLLGIIRHPKAHPLAPRGEEVLELIEYLPAEESLRVVGSRNITRRPVTGAEEDRP